MRTSSGAHATETRVITRVSENVSVKSLRMKASPRSASSFSARTSTGTTREVSTAPSTSSVTRFGSVLAVLNALATAPPSAEAINTVRRKPVMRLIRVAIAMEPPARTICSSLCFWLWPSVLSPPLLPLLPLPPVPPLPVGSSAAVAVAALALAAVAVPAVAAVAAAP